MAKKKSDSKVEPKKSENKIPKELTPEHIAMVPKYRDKWLKIGLCQDPVDMEAAVPAAQLAYKNAGFAPFKYAFESRGPMMNGYMAALLQNYPNGWDSIEWEHPLTKDTVVYYDDGEGEQTFVIVDYDNPSKTAEIKRWSRNPNAKLDSSVTKVRADQLRVLESPIQDLHCAKWSLDYLTEQLRDKYPDLDPGTLGYKDRVEKSVWEKDPWAVIIHESEETLKRPLFGAHEAAYLLYFDMFQIEFGITEASRLDGLIAMAKCCGWWIGRTEVVFLSDRHNRLKLDEQDQLHSTDGPAFGYPDGTGLWEMEGQQVDKQIVMAPETQSIEQILYEGNEEVRRIRIERYAGADAGETAGWLKFLKDAGAEELDFREYLHPIDLCRSRGMDETKLSDEEWGKLIKESEAMRLSGEAIPQDDPGYDLRQIETLVKVTLDGANRGDTQTIVSLLCGCPSSGDTFVLQVPPQVTTCEEAQTYLHTGASGDEDGASIILGRT